MNTFTPVATQTKDLNDYTVEDIQNILALAKAEAYGAAQTHIDEYGEQAYCGFAWVNIHGIKGNTKLGRAMKQAGYTKDYTGAYQIYNPAGYGGQSMDVKEAGARAAAKVFEQYGFTAYPGGRAD